jgi:phosphatidylserine/phosphatidylglycerophosphate/cardiolipin synthase-like enzyme
MYGSDVPDLQSITSHKAFAAFVMTSIRQALSEILIATYRLEFDAFGQPLLSELEYACQRGLHVRCLINSSGSKTFIHDHPTLLTSLQTQIRIANSPHRSGNCIVFDRQLAVVGHHDLYEPDPADQSEYSSRIITGTTAAEFAIRLNAEWH